MNIKQILKKGEGIDVEFKTSQFESNKDSFETICAFLNRSGGHLLLGVKNNGTVEGVIEDSLQQIINNIITNANNPQKLNPPFYLSASVVEFKNKKIIYIFIPESSQVHSTNGKIFDRNEDGDFDITHNNEQVTQLYLRKQSTYTENKVYPYIKIADFNTALMKRVRILAKNERTDHPWQYLTDKELLNSAGLYRHDPLTGKEGYTLAAVLLLGKDELIQTVLPHYKTDAILRIENTDRYDDRDDVRTNLIDSYERLMAFVRKHLPDKFYQEGVQRISLRERIFREVVSNILIHREFTNAFPAKLLIEKDRVMTENWNRPHGSGLIDPSNFSPYPKNPIIAKFFKEIGRIDELGSGVRNTFKYCNIYTPDTYPEFVEKDVFKTIIPVKIYSAPHSKFDSYHQEKDINDTLNDTLNNREKIILQMIKNNKYVSQEEMAKKCEVSVETIKRDIKKMQESNIVKRIGSKKTGYWELV